MNERTTTASDYEIGERLRHHGGSVWIVDGRGLPDDAFQGYYLIRCVVGTKRPGWIGGEEAGRVSRVHRDYLHGNGWRIEPYSASPKPERSEGPQNTPPLLVRSEP